jgi:hypothetical protein
MDELGRILTLTDEVERLVAEGRWGEASAVETKRHAMLVRYAQSGVCEQSALGSLHQRNTELLTRVGDSREALAAEAVREFGGVRGAGAYAALAGQAASEQGGSGHGNR